MSQSNMVNTVCEPSMCSGRRLKPIMITLSVKRLLIQQEQTRNFRHSKCGEAGAQMHSSSFKGTLKISITKRDGDRERSTFRLLVHSPDACINQGWAKLKPAGRRVIWVSCVAAGFEALGPSATATPSH